MTKKHEEAEGKGRVRDLLPRLPRGRTLSALLHSSALSYVCVERQLHVRSPGEGAPYAIAGKR